MPYIVRQIYTENMREILLRIHNFLVKKLLFPDQRRCRAVIISFGKLPCLNPAEKWSDFCKHHSARRVVDLDAYHLMDAYKADRAYAEHCTVKGINSEEMFEFNRRHDAGINVYYTAALEHHRRIVYQIRYQFEYCPRHAEFEAGLQGLYKEYYKVDASGITRLVPLHFINDDRRPIERADNSWTTTLPELSDDEGSANSEVSEGFENEDDPTDGDDLAMSVPPEEEIWD